jgi:hypothetical protein
MFPEIGRKTVATGSGSVNISGKGVNGFDLSSADSNGVLQLLPPPNSQSNHVFRRLDRPDPGGVLGGTHPNTEGLIHRSDVMTDSSVLSPPEPTEVLLSSPLPQLRHLVVSVNDSEVVITGRVTSYYLKQLAQEAIRPTLGHRRLLNRVEVSRS